MVAGVPHHGGATWAVLQYLLGLDRLGHEVWLVEPVDQPASQGDGAGFERSESAAYFRRVVAAAGLSERAALLLAGTRRTVGVPYEQIALVARRADLVINVSGMLTDPALLEPIPRR